MSFLFDDKSRRAFKWLWVVFAVLIIISMVILYAPGLFGGGGHSAPLL